MTLTQSDVNEPLEAIRAGGDIDVIRKAVELVLQDLIEAGPRHHRQLVELLGYALAVNSLALHRRRAALAPPGAQAA